MTAQQQAQWDFKDGCGQEANPYTKGSKDYDEYMWEMAKLWHTGFQETMEQLA